MLGRWSRISFADRQDQGITSVKEPKLGCVDAVPMAALLIGQQEVDHRHRRPIRGRFLPGLTVKPALRMRGQVQHFDDLVSSHSGRVRKSTQR